MDDIYFLFSHLKSRSVGDVRSRFPELLDLETASKQGYVSSFDLDSAYEVGRLEKQLQVCTTLVLRGYFASLLPKFCCRAFLLIRYDLWV